MSETTAPAFPATLTGHAVNGPVHVCMLHARKLEGLYRHLGAHINFTRAPDGAECSNCINEAAKAAKS